MELYARKCAISGKGMNAGWIIYDEYYSELQMANKIARENEFVDWEQMYEITGADNYYTEWDVEDEFNNGQMVFYLKNGDEVIVQKSQ